MHRPASYPYLSGDGFRSIANHIYDQFLDFNPEEVMYGDIIFVRTNYLPEFFTKIHILIKEPYVLLSNNEDSTVGSEFIKYIDDKIIHWYAQNIYFRHPKVTALPIGIQNLTVGNEEDFIHRFKSGDITSIDKKQNRILFGFTVGNTIEERRNAQEALLKSKIADQASLPRSEYYETLGTYKYIASPRGGGLDCHRTWEALYFKVIPILLRNQFSERLTDLGFPVLLIDTWQTVETFTAEYLAKYYTEHVDSFNTPKLFLSYWYDEFTKHRLK
ncbi:MAG: hypothetical protein V4664_00155 [Patescibacteria group bacterium]